jgi:PAS domain S-box-containing protein
LMKGSFTSSIRFKLTIVVLLAMLPAFALQVHASLRDHEREIAFHEETVMQLVGLAKREETRFIDGTHNLLAALASVPEVQSFDAERCNAFLSGLLEIHDSYANFGVADMDGDVWCSALPFSGPVTAADRSYFQNAIATGNFAIGEYQVGRITGKPGVNFGHTIRDSVNGEIIGVVFAAVGLDKLNLIESGVLQDLPSGSTLMKVDSEGTILVALPDADGWVGQLFPIPSILERIASTDSGAAQATDPDGVSRLYVFSPIDSPVLGAGLHIIVGIPTAAIYGEVNRQLAWNLIALSLVFALALTAVWVGSQRFLLKPLKALMQATQRLMQGDLSARTGLTESAGEVGILGDAFDSMAESLEQKEREGELYQRQLEFQAYLLDSTYDAILATDAEFNLTAWNRAAEKLYGWRAEEAIGKKVSEVIPSEFSNGERQGALRDMAEGKSLRLEVTQYRRDGEPIVVEGTTMALRGEGGHITGYVSVNRDVTERKRIAEALRESEENLRHAGQLAQIGYWSRDMASDELSWSEETYRIFGLQPRVTKIDMTTLTDHIFPEDRQRVLHAIRDALAGIRPYDLEYRAQRPDGSVRIVHSKGEVSRDEEGAAVRMFGFVLDITERKRAEEELEAANKELRSMARRLVDVEEAERRRMGRELHDVVGQALTALNINLSIIRGQLPGDVDSGIRARLQESIRQAEAIMEAIRFMMAELRPPVLDDYGLVPAVRWYAMQFAERTGIRVVVKADEGIARLPEDLELSFFAIVREALTNVAKHARATDVTLTVEREGDLIRLRIADKGKGFDPSILRGAGQETRWGLRIMRERAEAVGGHLQVKSVPGKGTEVIMEASPPG